MIAEEYGYEIRPGRALDTPGVEAILKRRERGVRLGALAAAINAVLLGYLLARIGDPTSPLSVLVTLGLGFAIAAIGVPTLLWRRARRKERRILTTYGWQVWPCATREVQVVSAEGRRANGRHWAKEGRVVLLRPDGQSHCSFPPPQEGWEGPFPPGSKGPHDHMWFAGDTRFGGVLAAPGGLPFRYVTRTNPATSSGRPRRTRSTPGSAG
ncbi:hypothetical protein DPM19_06875 [Actinomadura craniellae]|uniref:Uncharacterized protein n=1 Tax=Actinomadura craniellae TaxID=2231787 RepID=A0A365H930_9ACTN|nr:hypothetical protein [Actinomadura craniellae]RAY15522.1 hypothetical protein DPM19_06875 [Actinomadura craniellae]